MLCRCGAVVVVSVGIQYWKLSGALIVGVFSLYCLSACCGCKRTLEGWPSSSCAIAASVLQYRYSHRGESINCPYICNPRGLPAIIVKIHYRKPELHRLLTEQNILLFNALIRKMKGMIYFVNSCCIWCDTLWLCLSIKIRIILIDFWMAVYVVFLRGTNNF